MLSPVSVRLFRPGVFFSSFSSHYIDISNIDISTEDDIINLAETTGLFGCPAHSFSGGKEMKTRKFLSLALALIMAFAMIPVASLAENVDGLVNEAAAMRKLDNAWAALDAAEADALAQGMSRTEVINAVYNAALNLNTVDKDSFSDFTKDGFYFTVDGMYCAYNYRLRNELNTDCAPVEEGVVLTKGSGKKSALKDAESPNVFLIAPYYGHDSTFTDQYKREAQSIAEATGGEYLLIQSTSATGPAIAENFVDKGVVIFDSHGSQSGTSSYLCLTTSRRHHSGSLQQRLGSQIRQRSMDRRSLH